MDMNGQVNQTHSGSGDNIAGDKVIGPGKTANPPKNHSRLKTLSLIVGIVIPVFVAIWGVYAHYKPNEKSNTMNTNQSHFGSGDNIGRDKITNYINTPTVFEEVSRTWTPMLDGTYQLEINLKHIGDQGVPKLELKLMTGMEYLYVSSNPLFPALNFMIYPAPSVMSSTILRNGLLIHNLEPLDYNVTIHFSKRPPSEPLIKISPGK